MGLIAFLYRLSVSIALADAEGTAKGILKVTGGTTTEPIEIITSLSSLLVGGLGAVFGAIITAGGIMVAASHGNETWKENGKKAIMGGLMGYAVVLASYAIVQMVLSFIYCGDYTTCNLNM